MTSLQLTAKVKNALISTVLFSLLLSGSGIATQNPAQNSADGPVSVNLGDVYRKGNIIIENADLSRLPSLPRGYWPLPRMAYRITTDAVAVGPYTVVFGVPSIADEQTFRSLRIFHAEPDQFDPDNLVWVDRTATGLNAAAPDFSHKTITAYSDELETGIYVVAKLTEKIIPGVAVVDLEVVPPTPAEVVQMPANITLSVSVRNNGPQPATNVGLKQQINSGTVISTKSSQGICKAKPPWVYCKLGQLAVGASATVAVVIDPLPGFVGQYRSSIEVGSMESDSNPENNRGVAGAETRGDPNVPPEVTLESPDMEQIFEHGEVIVFKATANDPDGSITKVEFFDNEQSLGVGSASDTNHFSFSSSLANGFHVLTAVATDNGGRSIESGAKQVFVNGPINVRILKPAGASSLRAGSDLILTALATHPSGSIEKVEFVYNGFFLGVATEVGNSRYTIRLPRLEKTDYLIHAIATGDSGLVSKSLPLRLRVTR